MDHPIKSGDDGERERVFELQISPLPNPAFPLYTPRMFYTYMMANRPKGTIFIGHCDDLVARCADHKSGEVKGLITKHKPCDQLVWFEAHETRDGAYRRFVEMNGKTRSWTIKRIRQLNPKWADLSAGLTEASLSDPARVYPSDSALKA